MQAEQCRDKQQRVGRHEKLVVPARTLHHETADGALLEKHQLVQAEQQTWHFQWDTQDVAITAFSSNQVRPLCMSHQGGPIRARERKVVFKAVLRTLNLQGLTWAHRELVPQEWDPTSVKCQGKQLAAGTGILHSLGVLHLMFLAFFFFGLSVEVVFCRGRSLYRKQLKNNHHHHEETCLFVPQA